MVNARGNTDYVKDGDVYKNTSMQMVLVSGTQDFEALSNYDPGTIAYTAGFRSMWQKSPDGEWIAF